MTEKKPKYVIRYLMGISLAMACMAAFYGILVVLLLENRNTLLLLTAAFFGALGIGVWYMSWIYRHHFEKSEQIMKLFASGYTIRDISQLDWYASKGTEMALKKAMELLDTGALLRVSKKQAQYLALQNQINPHFLYNTLEGIRSEAVIAGLDVVADMTEALARFFRYTISKVENLVTLSDEIDNIKTYFSIQQFRFGERLHLTIEYPEEKTDILGCYLPKLTLQPIVENAIIHGLEQKIGAGEVQIVVSRTSKRLIIQISDNGIGIEKKVLEKMRTALEKTTYEYIDGRSEGGIALINVNNRIRLLFGEEYGLVINSVKNFGTDVTVTLPIDLQGKR